MGRAIIHEAAVIGRAVLEQIGGDLPALMPMDPPGAYFEASFRQGENDLAVVGGVDFRLHLEQLLVFGHVQALKTIRFDELIEIEVFGPPAYQAGALAW